ncbi:ini1 [Candida jiufengensis]|uniref:ini1 n=1 Tax=Candida jiufengensis TaxID=497108 RepID=UPI002225A7E3|nr:ini1 [Candida jiufengensis]KAI5955880.1 ini1 [Candida jiufengensis]
MSRHQYDLIQCMKQPGKEIGKLCSNCDGHCPICDSMVKPYEKVHICSQCYQQTNLNNKCLICGNNTNNSQNDGGNGENIDAYYCFECCKLDKNREGCPRIINVGGNKIDYIYSKKQNQSSSKSLENI